MANETLEFGLFDSSDYITERVNDFSGRAWVFQAIDQWLSQPGSGRFFLLTGKPGSGKSAIAERLAQFSTGKALQPPECQRLTPKFLHAVHFCSATASNWLDPRTFARSIAIQLGNHIQEFNQALLAVGDQNITINAPIRIGAVGPGANVTAVEIKNITIHGMNGQEAFNRLVLDPMQSIYETGYEQPIVIMVDSLDESLATNTAINIVDLIQGVLGLDKRIRFILTSRTEPRVENALQAKMTLSLSDQAYRNENNADITRFVTLKLHQKDLASKAAALSPSQAATMAKEICARAEGNFQYVVFLLKAIADGKQPLDNLGGLPAGLDGLYHQSLHRVVKLGKKGWIKAYQPFLGVLAAAQEPLTLELIKTYIASKTSLRNVYTDLNQFVEAVDVLILPGVEPYKNASYRIYHQSMIDFLNKEYWVIGSNGKMQVFNNLYWIDAAKWHGQIVNSCKGRARDWSQVDWKTAELYTLRHLVGHLYWLRGVKSYRESLHALLETRSFIDEHLDRLKKPYLVLDDLRLALSLALEDDDLAQAWRHIHEYRRVLHDQLDFEKFAQAVKVENKTGNYLHIMENTILYGYMPNSQALVRLWAAWNAAANGFAKEASDMIKRALDRLPSRGAAQAATGQGGSLAMQAMEDAVGEALHRLLIRIARSAMQSFDEQKDWLREAISSWPQANVEAIVGRLTESLAEWGKIVDAQKESDTMESLLQKLQKKGMLNADVNSSKYRYGIYSFQKKLAAGLFRSRGDPKWLEYISKTVGIIALDDYPSYREVALSWVAVAILAQEDITLALEALMLVLEGMFKPSPGFWGDVVAAGIDGMDSENNQGPSSAYLLGLLEHVEATGERGVDPSVLRKMPEIIEWRLKVGLPEDPWSFRMRRLSAVAAVLHRRGDTAGAESLLEEASAESHQGSYAGFRALARLSLACRWMEWGLRKKANDETGLAENDAGHMNDDILLQERRALVKKVRGWIGDYGPNPASLNESDAFTQLQRMSGLERWLFIELLFALWADNAARLKWLLPLALDDATTADAVLGRLLGVEAQQAQPGKPFYQLAKALRIDSGVE